MSLGPREYRILRDVQAALSRIAVSGGYYHDVGDLRTVKLDPNASVEALVGPDAPRPFVVLSVGSEVWDYTDAPEQADTLFLLTVPFTVHWFNSTDATRDEAKLEEFYQACADIEQAIGIDPTRGLLASDTRIVRRTLEDVDGTELWLSVDLQVRLYRGFGRPND